MGYAAGFHGWERVVCVLNTAFGDIADLPFDVRQRRIVGYELRPGEDKKAPRKALAGMLRNTILGMLSHPDSGQQAQSYVLLDCPLTEDEYDIQSVRVHANQYQRLVLDMENPLKNTLTSVHVCYKGFDLFYMPWRHKARKKNEPVAGGYYYYWLSDNQLEALNTKPQTVRFILKGTRCGDHNLVVVWRTGGVGYSREIKVIVEPEPN